MSKPAKKAVYRIRNWAAYSKALVRRGSLTVWVDEAALAAWGYDGPNQWGAQFRYSDLAVQCLLTLRAVFHLPLRATEGLAGSVFGLMGLALDVPHYSTLSRRAATAVIALPKQSEGPLHLVIDSTGLKVYGEGEWKVRRHGASKRRAWRKLHLAVDAESHELQAVMLGEAGLDDAEVVAPLLEQVDRPVESAAADGAYDKRKVYAALVPRASRIAIPPRGNARIWQHGNSAAPPLVRDENLRGIRALGRREWKRRSGYHRRSLAETAVFRFKRLFGGRLACRRWECQATEVGVRSRALNIMTHLGMPETVRLA